jgi:TRAP-type C4-dicarboxylate transport system substrate-binding protein
MKKLFRCLFLVFFVVSVIALFTTTSSFAADQIKLKLSTWVNKAAPMGQSVVWWAEQVEKRTNGKVKVQLFFDQQLATAVETLQITRTGGVDIGGIVPGFAPQDWPLNQALSDAWDFKGYRDRAWITARIYDEVPALVEEMRKNNLVMLTQPALPLYALWSTKPIRKPADFNGLRVRTWGNEYPKRYTPFGAVPTTVLMAEAYEAMAKGLLDANPLPIGDALTTGLWEISKYCLVEPSVNIAIGHTLFMNLDRWNKLPPDIKKILMEICDDSSVAFVKLNEKIEVEARQKIESNSKGKIEFVNWSEEDAKMWHDNVQHLVNIYLHEYMPTIGQKENAELLWNKLNELTDQYEKWKKTPEAKGYFD